MKRTKRLTIYSLKKREEIHLHDSNFRTASNSNASHSFHSLCIENMLAQETDRKHLLSSDALDECQIINPNPAERELNFDIL